MTNQTRGRTSAGTIFWNFYFKMMLPMTMVLWLLGLLPFFAALAAALFGNVVFVGIVWAFVTVLQDLLYAQNPEYQAARRAGWRPFWDGACGGFKFLNPDSPLTMATGLAEPEYTGFVPPDHWRFQCPQCGARVETQIIICWNCNYGADGNSRAYYERNGTPPPDAPEHKLDGVPRNVKPTVYDCETGWCDPNTPDDWFPMK